MSLGLKIRRRLGNKNKMPQGEYCNTQGEHIYCPLLSAIHCFCQFVGTIVFKDTLVTSNQLFIRTVLQQFLNAYPNLRIIHRGISLRIHAAIRQRLVIKTWFLCFRIALTICATALSTGAIQIIPIYHGGVYKTGFNRGDSNG